jgi:hypothetical protein
MLTLMLVFFWAALIVGWAANIIQVVGLVSGDITALLIIKCVGVIAPPLGSVLGWAGLF